MVNIFAPNSDGRLVQVDLLGSESFGYVQVAHASIPTGQGGTFTTGDWQTRPLTVILEDTNEDLAELNGLSPTENVVSNNTVPLKEGTYDVIIQASSYRVGQEILRLRATDSSQIIYSTCNWQDTTNDAQLTNYLIARVSVPSGGKEYLIEHRCTRTQSSTGLGFKSTSGDLAENPCYFLLATFEKVGVSGTTSIGEVTSDGRIIASTVLAGEQYGCFTRRLANMENGGAVIEKVWNNVPLGEITQNEGENIKLSTPTDFVLPSGTPIDPLTVDGILAEWKASSYALTPGDPITTNWIDDTGNGYDMNPSSSPTFQGDHIEFDNTLSQLFNTPSDFVNEVEQMAELTMIFVVQLSQTQNANAHALWGYGAVNSSSSRMAMRLDSLTNLAGVRDELQWRFKFLGLASNNNILFENFGEDGELEFNNVTFPFIITMRSGPTPDKDGHQTQFFWGKKKIAGGNPIVLPSMIDTGGNAFQIGREVTSSSTKNYFRGNLFHIDIFNKQLSDNDLANVWAHLEATYTDIEEPFEVKALSSIGTLEAQWLSTQGITTSSGKVTSWIDQINSVDVINGSTGPSYLDFTINDLPVLDFDGSQHLEIALPSNLATLDEFTCIIVYKLSGATDLTDDYTILSFSDTSATDNFFRWIASSEISLDGITHCEGMRALNSGTDIWTQVRVGGTHVDSGAFRKLVTFNSNTGRTINGVSGEFPGAYVNNTFVDTNAAAAGPVAVSNKDKLIIGSHEDSSGISGGLKGQIAEIIFFNGDIGTNGRLFLNNYLEDRYGTNHHFQLKAGTYNLHGQIIVYANNSNLMARLYNDTTGEVMALGTSSFCSLYGNNLHIIKTITLASDSKLKFQVFFEGGSYPNGFGRGDALNDGTTPNIYMKCIVRRSS